MIDFTFYMDVWYKSLAYIFAAIVGSVFVSFLLFGGSVTDHIGGSFVGVSVAVFIGYHQKRKLRAGN